MDAGGVELDDRGGGVFWIVVGDVLVDALVGSGGTVRRWFWLKAGGWSSTSRRMLPIRRLQMALTRGARGGMRRILRGSIVDFVLTCGISGVL